MVHFHSFLRSTCILLGKHTTNSDRLFSTVAELLIAMIVDLLVKILDYVLTIHTGEIDHFVVD
jgi:hypothetical protein